MARQGIGTGSSPNDGTGDNLRTGAAKINDNFGELYTYFGDGTNLNFSGGVWNTVSAGINTLSSVGIGTTNPRFTLEVGAVGASGTSLYVNGDARVTGILTVGSSSISLNGSTNEITVGTGITISGNTGIISATQVNIGGEILTGAGVTSLVAGSNITLSGSTGQVTINSSGGGGAGVGNTNNIRTNFLEVSGISTFNGGVGITGDIDSTNLETGTGYLTLGNSSSQFDINFSPSSGSSPAIRYNVTNGISIYGRYNGGADLLEDVRFGDPSYFKNIIPKADSTYNLGTDATRWAAVYSDHTETDTLNVSGISTIGSTLYVGPSSNQYGVIIKRGATDGGEINLTGPNSTDANSTYYSNIRLNKVGGGFKYDLEFHSNGYSAGDIGDFVFYRRQTSNGRTERMRLSGETGDLIVTGGGSFVGIVTVGAGTSTNSVNTPALTLSHNNPTIAGTSGTTGNIKSIGGAPFYYDGTNWREFVLATGTPVSQPEDTDWDNVIIRNDFDTSLTEQRFGQTVFSGSSTNVDLVTSPVKVGTKSARIGFGGNGNVYALGYPKRSEYDFTGAWTIEGWFYLDTLPPGTGFSAVPLFAHTYLADNTWGLNLEQIGTTLYFRWLNNSSSTYSATATSDRGVSLGAYSNSTLDQAWAHIALVRKASNGSIHLYVNGTESASTSSDQIIDNDIPAFITSYEFWFGKCRIRGTNDIWMDGNIDDIRVSTSERYTSNFNPPTTTLPISGTGSTTYTPPGSKQGEISLGGSPAWTGTTGVTASQIAAGQYRATFATAYSNATDYVIQTSMNDYTPATTPVGIGVSRFTTHADFFINRVSDGANIDTGSLAIDLFKK